MNNNAPSIEMCYDLIIATLKANAPKDTGNLSTYAIRRTENTVTIGAEQAPYAVYTEEKNKSSKGWIRKTMDGLIPILKSILQGNLTAEEVRSMINTQNNIYNKDMEKILKREQEKLNKFKSKKGG